MKFRAHLLLALIILGSLPLLAPFLLPAPAWGEELSEYGNPFTRVSIGQVAVKAEVVKTPEKLYLGLSQREGLPKGRGMLFVMPSLQVQIFCMRGMKFPLDLLWLVPGRVVGLTKDVSPAYQGDLVSPAPVNFVLEVPGGFCDRHGIQINDRASW